MRVFYFIAFISVLLIGLAIAFPDALGSDFSQMRLIYLLCWLVLLTGSYTIQRANAKKNIKNAAIWLVIIASLALVYELLAKMSGWN